MEASSVPKTSSKRTSKTTSKRGRGYPRRVQDLSKEELHLTLQKKKECNAKALKIVESMLEPLVKEEWFLDMLQHLNQSHLQDVSEERAIVRLCGYPLCANELKNVPSQQFRISTKLNKVYDITERKNFCSNLCFKACKFIKDQMYSSPLWLRDIEPSVKFVLMPSTGVSGGAGDEVNVQLERVTREAVLELHEDRSASEAQSLKELSEKSMVDTFSNLNLVTSMQRNETSSFSESVGSPDEKTDDSLKAVNTADHSECMARMCSEKIPNDENQRKCSTKSVEEEISGSAVKDLLDMGVEGRKPKVSTVIQPTSPFSNALADKMNEKNYNSVKEISSKVFLDQGLHKQNLMEDGKVVAQDSNYVNTKSSDEKITKVYPVRQKSSANDLPLSTTGHVTAKKSAIKIAKSNSAENLEMKERRPKKDINAHPASLSIVSHVEKCVQEWFTMETMCYLFGEGVLKDMLKQKGERIQAHYKALSSLTWDQDKHERFLAICKRLSLLEIEENNFDTQVMTGEGDSKRKPLPDYNALKREAEAMELKIKAFYKGKLEVEEKKVSFAEDVNDSSAEREKDAESQIPLVHLHSQRALRKKIVLDGLQRVLPDFLRTFGMRPSDWISSVRGLISTFALTSTNITFRPQEWSLLGLIVIKLLSLREPEVKQCLQLEQSNTYLTLMLMSFKEEPGYLDRLLSWLTDIDNLLSREETEN